MSKTRRSHVTKTDSDRQEYRDNIIKPVQVPTRTIVRPIDTTTRVIPEEEIDDSYSPRHRHGIQLALEWLREFGFAKILPIVITALLAVVGYLWMIAFALNREMGETQQQLLRMERGVSDLRSAASDTEARTIRNQERIERRMERLEEHILATQTSQESRREEDGNN